MKYLLLIYESEAGFAGMSGAEQARIFEEYMDYTKGIRKSGNYIGGGAPQAISTPTPPRVKKGKKITTHRPLPEAREQPRGLHLLHAQDPHQGVKPPPRPP